MTEWNRAYWWQMWCPECGDAVTWSCQGASAKGRGQSDPFSYLASHAYLHLRREHGFSDERSRNLLGTASEFWEVTHVGTGERRSPRDGPGLVRDLDRFADLLARLADG